VISHEEVLAIGKEKSDLMKKLVAKIVELIPSGI
jgi:purine nucleoside phosphorylase